MSTKIQTPAYARFVNQLVAKFQSLDIPLVPVAEEGAKDGFHGNEGWVLFQVIGTEDKLYARRTRGGDPTTIHTSIPFDLIPPALVKEDLRGKVGKIEASIKVDLEGIASGLLPVYRDRLLNGDKLRASKAPVRRASGGASPAALDSSERAELDALRAAQAAQKAQLEREEADRRAAAEASVFQA